MSISNEDEFDEDLNISVMFASGSNGELRTVPLNIGNRFHLLYELNEQGHDLIIAGLPGDDTDTQLEMLSEVVETFKTYLEAPQFESALRGRNSD